MNHILRPLVSALLLFGGCAPTLVGVREAPVDYQVGDYSQTATLHAPVGGPLRRPALLLLHSGFFGVQGADRSLAREVAGRGVLVAVPAYRGQRRLLDGDRSEGRIEFCGGEVDDALALLRLVAARSDVDSRRLVAIGFSHGGCIALRLASLESGLRAVAVFSAPTDAAAAYLHLRDHPLANVGFNGWIASRIRTFVGGEPQALPAAYRLRSPRHHPPRADTAVLLVHGLADDIIPPQHACWLRDELRRAGRYVVEKRFDEEGAPVRAAAPACGQAAINPPRSRGPRAEVWFVEGQGHTFGKRPRAAMEARAVRFLLSVISR